MVSCLPVPSLCPQHAHHLHNLRRRAAQPCIASQPVTPLRRAHTAQAPCGHRLTASQLGGTHRLEVCTLVIICVLAFPVPLRCNSDKHNIELAEHGLFCLLGQVSLSLCRAPPLPISLATAPAAYLALVPTRAPPAIPQAVASRAWNRVYGHAEAGRSALARRPTSLSTSELGREDEHIHDCCGLGWRRLDEY